MQRMQPIQCHFCVRRREASPRPGPSSVAGKMDRPFDRQTYFNFIRECPRHFLARRKRQGVMKNLPCDDEPDLSGIRSIGCTDSRVYVTAVLHNIMLLDHFNRYHLLFFTSLVTLSPFLPLHQGTLTFVSRLVASLFTRTVSINEREMQGRN